MQNVEKHYGKKRKIEREALEWQQEGKLKGYLLQGRPLRDAKEFMQLNTDDPNIMLSSTAEEFVDTSTKKSKRDILNKAITIIALPITVLTPLVFHFSVLLIGSWSLYQENCSKNILNHFFLDYRLRFGGEEKKEISGLRLCGNNLSRINLSNARIHLISDSNFSDSDFSNSNLHGLILREVNMEKVNLESSFLKDVKFIEADLKGAKLAGSNLNGAVFKNTDLQEAELYLATLENAIFINSDLSAIDLDEKQIESMNFCNCQLPPEHIDKQNRDCSNPAVKVWI
ncbi:MAG: pentapeptide repeat-containing protein [Leptolyngbya sp. SIOISBB]|nr:pentapeptide repeat-containing protein [Leptolyngbya sp. SIOISBB]